MVFRHSKHVSIIQLPSTLICCDIIFKILILLENKSDKSRKCVLTDTNAGNSGAESSTTRAPHFNAFSQLLGKGMLVNFPQVPHA